MASAALLFFVAVPMLAIVTFRPTKLGPFSSEACPGLDPGWMPVRVKKTRQNKRLEPGSDSFRTDKALADGQSWSVDRRPDPPTTRQPCGLAPDFLICSLRPADPRTLESAPGFAVSWD